jgi:hypothetical protein
MLVNTHINTEQSTHLRVEQVYEMKLIGASGWLESVRSQWRWHPHIISCFNVGGVYVHGQF